MNPRPTRTLLSFVCLSFALTVGPTRGAEPVAPPTPRIARPGTLTVDVDFPGGTFAQFVARLKSSDGAGFDLLSDAALAETPMPRIRLANIELQSLIVAVQSLLRGSNVMITAAPSNVLVLTKNPVFVPAPLPPGPTFQAFQLAPYLATLSIDDITDAIATAWAGEPKRDPKAVTLKFHPATKVLFVYGPAEAITMATQIIPQLSPTATPQSMRDIAVSRMMSSVVAPPDTAAESARLEAVAAEVRVRRAQREAAAAAAMAPEKK